MSVDRFGGPFSLKLPIDAKDCCHIVRGGGGGGDVAEGGILRAICIRSRCNRIANRVDEERPRAVRSSRNSISRFDGNLIGHRHYTPSNAIHRIRQSGRKIDRSRMDRQTRVKSIRICNLHWWDDKDDDGFDCRCE